LDCNANGMLDVCEGPQNRAASFDGSNDFILLPYGVVPWRTSNVTVEAWFRTTTNGVILGEQTRAPFISPPQYVPILYVRTDGPMRSELWGGTSTPLAASAAVNDGQWHHAAISYDGGTFRMYLDGQLAASRAGGLSNYGDATLYYQIGIGFADATISPATRS